MLTSFSPIFPVRDLSKALAHYRALGFEVHAHADGDEYGFANRDGISLHLSVVHDLDPKVGAAAAYLYVDDADALAHEWNRPGVGGTTHRAVDTEYGLREAAHIDPYGNLIRFGSRMGERMAEPVIAD